MVIRLDKVIAVPAAGGDSVTLFILGLVISIPLVIFGSTLLMKLMERLPIIVTAGGALPGFVAGETAVSDSALADWLSANFQILDKKPSRRLPPGDRHRPGRGGAGGASWQISGAQANCCCRRVAGNRQPMYFVGSA